jgi:hypothetical protein
MLAIEILVIAFFLGETWYLLGANSGNASLTLEDAHALQILGA